MLPIIVPPVKHPNHKGLECEELRLIRPMNVLMATSLSVQPMTDYLENLLKRWGIPNGRRTSGSQPTLTGFVILFSSTSC